MTELFIVPRWISFEESKPNVGTVCLILSSYGIGIAEYKDKLGFCSDENDKYSIRVTSLGHQYDICNDDVEYWVHLDDVYELARTDSNSIADCCKKCGAKFNSPYGDWVALIANCTGTPYCICKKCSIKWSNEYELLIERFFGEVKEE